MNTYYYEYGCGYGRKPFVNDIKAVDSLKEKFGKSLMVVYRESDTEDGLPLIVLFEGGK